MNKFLELRKKLILRLIIIELNLYGYLEILEPLFLGSVDAARSQLMKTELTPGTIRAITQAFCFLAEHGRGTLNIGGIAGNLNTRLCQPIGLEYYINIGEMKINHNPQYLTPIPLRGSVRPSIFMEGRLEESPPMREAEGKIIFGYQWQGHGLYGPAISTEGRLLKKSPSMDTRALTAGSFNRDGIIQFSTNSWGKACGVEETYNREGLIANSCINLGYAMTSAILRICRSASQFDIVMQGVTPKNNEAISTRGQLLDGALCRGYINLQITRIINGYSGFTILPTAKLRVYTEENGLLVPPRDFLEGCVLPVGEIITLNGQPTCGQISLSFSSITQHRIDGILPCKQDLYMDTVSILTLPRTRTEEELMGLQGEFWHVGFILNALPSYQHRSGVYGTLQLSERLLVDAMSEQHTTMYYEVIPDEVNGGDTYEITTKYHKDVDGIVSIGWRYFGYLIE